MKLSALLGGLTIFPTPQSVPKFPALGPTATRSVRTNNMLINPPGHPPTPHINAVTTSSFNISDVQAEVLIVDAAGFKRQMNMVIPTISTVDIMLDTSTQPTATFNMALSQSGLDKLGIHDNLNDTIFSGGQFADAPNLAELTDTWVSQFKGTSIHGVYITASDASDSLMQQNSAVQTVLGTTISVVYSIQGQARPGDQAGHEHFGFLDGISQPTIEGFGTPLPGQAVVPAGTLLLGREQDLMTRPSWATDSSFVAFRQLKQLVPEFNTFANDHPASISGMSQAQAAELTQARMMGRWKSGAPVDLAPLFDDPALGADPMRNNNFNFSHPGFNLSSNQVHCPFSAHIRKNVPRTDLNPIDVGHHILRSGIPYGPEVTEVEQQSGQTMLERGLLFLAVQSNIGAGFQFLQKLWINNPDFVGPKSVKPGLDPIMGQISGSARFTIGLDPMDPEGNTTLPMQFVISRGGEYFLMPSLTALRHIINS
ncbi:hypothetical protein Clacol_003551 [Clathrus columnatus]|uniref:Uncharacterized protein n=1 Tax=Clathrus columnatus TaxID=1419009 RepID=A0AAV5A3V6_9AGAM|nr:hypothetical protein Clacol_003551 [Clathrus columnatus]